MQRYFYTLKPPQLSPFLDALQSFKLEEPLTDTLPPYLEERSHSQKKVARV